jgi:hypothetical protein
MDRYLVKKLIDRVQIGYGDLRGGRVGHSTPRAWVTIHRAYGCVTRRASDPSRR